MGFQIENLSAIFRPVFRPRISDRPARLLLQIIYRSSPYPAIRPEDIDAALAYAAEPAREGSIDLPAELTA